MSLDINPNPPVAGNYESFCQPIDDGPGNCPPHSMHYFPHNFRINFAVPRMRWKLLWSHITMSNQTHHDMHTGSVLIVFSRHIPSAPANV